MFRKKNCYYFLIFNSFENFQNHDLFGVTISPPQQFHFSPPMPRFGFIIFEHAQVQCTRTIKVGNGAKIRNRYNQVPHLTQDTNGKVTNSQKTPQTRAKRSALSQQVTTKHI